MRSYRGPRSHRATGTTEGNWVSVAFKSSFASHLKSENGQLSNFFRSWECLFYSHWTLLHILTKLCREHDTSCAATLRNLMLLLKSYFPYIWFSVFDISLFDDWSELISLSSCQALIVRMLHMHNWNFSLFNFLVNSDCSFSLCKNIEMSGSGRLNFNTHWS